MSLHLITSAPSAVAASDADYRADLVTRFVTATNWVEELALLAEAARYDRDNPTLPPLTDELHGSQLGDVA